MSEFDSVRFEALWREFKELPDPEKTEENLFALGGNGYFENPASDLLAFYLNPHKPHELGELVLRTLLDAAAWLNPVKLPAEISSVVTVEREIVTPNRNRLDILIEAVDYVIVVENKIFHRIMNPFKDYEHFIEEKYPGKKKYFLLLSLTGESPDQTKWFPVKYSDFLTRLTIKLSEAKEENKWLWFLREFIANLRSYTGDSGMKKERLVFYEKYAEEIGKLASLREEYSNHVWGDRSNLEPGLISNRSELSIRCRFRTTHSGIILYYGNRNTGSKASPHNYTPVLYIGLDGKLRGQVWHGAATPMTSLAKINDGQIHEVHLAFGKDLQTLKIDNNKPLTLRGKIDHLNQTFNMYGNGYANEWPACPDFWFPFRGEILELIIATSEKTDAEILFELRSPIVLPEFNA